MSSRLHTVSYGDCSISCSYSSLPPNILDHFISNSSCIKKGEFGDIVAFLLLVLAWLGFIEPDYRCARLGPSTYIVFVRAADTSSSVYSQISSRD